MANARLRLEIARSIHDQMHDVLALPQLYFAAFAAGKAVLRQGGHHPVSHAGVHDHLYHLHGGQIDTRLLSRLRQEREACDYRLSVPEPSHVRRRLDETEYFIAQADALLYA